jgi:hypothetical protein
MKVINRTLADLEERKKELKQNAETIKERLIENAVILLSKLSIEDIHNKASELYWEEEKTGECINKAFRRVLNVKFTPRPRTVETECPVCEKPSTVTYTSWTDQNRGPHYTNRDFCAACKKELADNYKKQQKKDLEEERIRQEEIDHLRSMPYKEYLATEHWKNKRQTALRRAGYECHLCSKKSSLQVHHRTYERRGHEYQSDLVVLCRTCHEKHHNIIAEEEE